MPLFDKVCYNMRGVKSDSRKIEYNKIEYINIYNRKGLVEYGNKYDKTYKCNENL